MDEKNMIGEKNRKYVALVKYKIHKLLYPCTIGYF